MRAPLYPTYHNTVGTLDKFNMYDDIISISLFNSCGCLNGCPLVHSYL